MQRFIVFFAIVFLLLGIVNIGCSGANVVPVTAPEGGKPPFDAQADRESNRTLWGIYSFNFDIAKGLVEARLLRAADAHFEITDWLLPPECDDCLAISINSFDPVNRILDVDVTLKNRTGFTAYDVRGILYTNIYGHELRNDDALTELWDILGGLEINPFKAFAKSEPYRVFAPDDEHTENYLIYIPTPPHWNDIVFAVDVSWPGNCKEPYGIENFHQIGVLYDYSTAAVEIQVDVFDWQNDVTEVLIYAPELTGEPFNTFTFAGGNTWSTELVNVNSVEPGDYQYLVKAKSSNQDVNTLYKYCTIEITEYPNFPDFTDVTPPWLNFTPRDIAVAGDYAYTASDVNGFHVFDISEPAMPEWTGWVDTTCAADKVIVSDGIAYVLASNYLVYLIDITTPESPSIISEICIEMSIEDFDVADGYAYINSFNEMRIFDVDPPDAPALVNTIETGGTFRKVLHHNGYVYAHDSFFGTDAQILIIDIDPPESASIVKAIDDIQGYNIVFQGDYAFSLINYKIWILDVSVPESAEVIYTISTGCMPSYMRLYDNYLYLMCLNHNKLCILDISVLGEAELVNQLDIFYTGIAFKDGYAYSVNRLNGIEVLNVQNPESPNIVNNIYSPGYADNVHVSAGYAYVLGGHTVKTLDIIDIDPFSEMQVVKRVPLPSYFALDFYVSDDYAYVISHEMVYPEPYGLMFVLDINPPEDSYIVNTIEISSYPVSFKIFGDYGYLGDNHECLQILDLTIPDAPQVIKVINEVYGPADFEIRDGYAFCVNNRFGVADVDPPESAHLVNDDFPFVGIQRIAVYGNYAFTVGANEQDMYVYDISEPEDAYLVNTFSIAPWNGLDVAALGDYVFVSGWQSDGTFGVLKLDVNPVDSVELVDMLEIPSWGKEIFEYDNFLYVADREGGLRIISLE